MNKIPRIDFNNIELRFPGSGRRAEPQSRSRKIHRLRCEDFVLLPGVKKHRGAERCGRKVIVVTNQRGIALGLIFARRFGSRFTPNCERSSQRTARIWTRSMFARTRTDNAIAASRYTGLFEQAFRDFPEATPERSIMVGRFPA